MAATTRRPLIVSAALLLIAVLVIPLVLRPNRPPISAVLPTGVLRVGMDPSYPPFAQLTDGTFTGIDPAIAAALAAELGVTFQIEPVSFDGLYDALLTDRVDVVISALIPDPARRDRIAYTAPYFNAGIALVSPAAQPLPNWDALRNRRVAFAYGSDAHGELLRRQRTIAPGELRPYERPTYALDAVRVGDADTALVTSTDARLYAAAYPQWEFTIAPVSVVPYAAALRADRIDLVGWVTEAFDRLLTTGQIDALIAEGFTAP